LSSNDGANHQEALYGLLCERYVGTELMLSGGQAAQFAAEHSRVHDVANAPQQRLEQEYPPPPKKPLTPYMRFNKLVSLCSLIIHFVF